MRTPPKWPWLQSSIRPPGQLGEWHDSAPNVLPVAWGDIHLLALVCRVNRVPQITYPTKDWVRVRSRLCRPLGLPRGLARCLVLNGSTEKWGVACGPLRLRGLCGPPGSPVPSAHQQEGRTARRARGHRHLRQRHWRAGSTRASPGAARSPRALSEHFL